MVHKHTNTALALCIYVSICLYVNVFMYLCIYASMYLMYLSIYFDIKFDYICMTLHVSKNGVFVLILYFSTNSI